MHFEFYIYVLYMYLGFLSGVVRAASCWLGIRIKFECLFFFVDFLRGVAQWPGMWGQERDIEMNVRLRIVDHIPIKVAFCLCLCLYLMYLSMSPSRCVCLTLSLTHTHTLHYRSLSLTHTRTRARARAHTHTPCIERVVISEACHTWTRLKEKKS